MPTRKLMSRYMDSSLMSGLGHRRRRIGVRRPVRRGAGFFGDLWDGIKSGVSTIAPHVLPFVANLAMKRFGGRRRVVHRRRRVGGAGITLLGGARRRVVHHRRRRIHGGATPGILM